MITNSATRRSTISEIALSHQDSVCRFHVIHGFLRAVPRCSCIGMGRASEVFSLNRLTERSVCPEGMPASPVATREIRQARRNRRILEFFVAVGSSVPDRLGVSKADWGCNCR